MVLSFHQCHYEFVISSFTTSLIWLLLLVMCQASHIPHIQIKFFAADIQFQTTKLFDIFWFPLTTYNRKPRQIQPLESIHSSRIEVFEHKEWPWPRTMRRLTFQAWLKSIHSCCEPCEECTCSHDWLCINIFIYSIHLHEQNTI